jgi:hypothetical protein
VLPERLVGEQLSDYSRARRHTGLSLSDKPAMPANSAIATDMRVFTRSA